MTAKHLTCSIENYHRNPAIGCSMLKAYADHPLLYKGRYVTGEAAPFTGTPSTDFGSMVDAYLLEPDRCLIIPADVLGKGGKKNTKAWRAWRDEHAGFVYFTEKDVTICKRIEENIHEHVDAAKLLFGHDESQYSIFWTDPETGLECKCRPDIVRPGVLVDLKTSKSTAPREFAKQCENLRYYWQQPHYLNGWKALTGEDRPFIFLVVKNAEPYDVATFTLSEEWIERGQREIRETLNDIADRTETGVWLPPGYGRTVELSPPRYTEYDDQYALGEDE